METIINIAQTVSMLLLSAVVIDTGVRAIRKLFTEAVAPRDRRQVADECAKPLEYYFTVSAILATRRNMIQNPTGPRCYPYYWANH